MGDPARSGILRAVKVDFARPPRWPTIVLWLLAAASLAAAGWVGARDLQDWDSLSAKKARTAALQAQLEAVRVARVDQAASAAQPPPFALDAKRWMALSRLDGIGVLRTVESAQVMGAKVVAIDVNAESRSVELEIEVTNAEVAAAYLQALNAGTETPVWTLVRVQMQSAIESALIRGQLQ